MFSRSKNSNLQKPRKLHSLEYLKYLYNVLQKSCDSTSCDVEKVVECLRLFSEIIVWGDQNDGSIMDFFWEQNALELLIRYVKNRRDRAICIQLLQSLNILFENLTNNRVIYYLLSQNHANGIILHDFDFSDEEIIGYYIAFLKALSFRVNEDTINFFYDETRSSFPLYQRAVQFFNHPENMVRIAVRTITLNIFKVRHVACSLYVYAHTSVPYFSHLTEEIRRTTASINESICLSNRLAKRGRIEDLVAEAGDQLRYIDDIFALGVTDLTGVLCLVLLRHLLLPFYVASLTKRHPPLHSHNGDEYPTTTSSMSNRGGNAVSYNSGGGGGGGGGSYLFHAVAMFLLAQVFTVLHQPELIRVLTEAILIGDLSLFLLLPSPPNSSPHEVGVEVVPDSASAAAGQLDHGKEEEEAEEGGGVQDGEDVLAVLRAAHHGKRVVRTAPAGTRLSALLQTVAACGVAMESAPNHRRPGLDPKRSLLEDISECSTSIQRFIEASRQLAVQNQGKSQSAVSSDSLPKSGSSSEFVTQLADTPTNLSPSQQQQPLSKSPPVTDNAGLSNALEGGGSGFTLTGKPFLRALFRSLEVGPGTDYDTFFALSLLIAIKRNGGLDEETLALAQLNTHTNEAPCNAMLMTKLLDVISDATKMGSRVRVATLDLALFLLVLITRDASRNCQLTENQRQQLETAFSECRGLLHDLYLTEPEFRAMFEFEVCRFRRQKLCPSKLLENTAFLFSQAEDAIKLFSNHADDAATTPHSTPDTSEPYTTLPHSAVEHMQRIIAVFLCLQGYISAYELLTQASKRHSGSEEIQNEVTPPDLARVPELASFGDIPPRDKVLVVARDLIDITQRQLFGCEVENQSGQVEKRYLIITDVQIIFVEPCPRTIGWGIVNFAGLIQDTELHYDAGGCVLGVVVYKSGDRATQTVRRLITGEAEEGVSSSSPFSSSPFSVFPRLNAKLRFLSDIQCSTIHTALLRHASKIAAAKEDKLKKLLQVSEKPTRSSAQSLLLADGEAVTLAPRSIKTSNTTTTATAVAAPTTPTTLLQKATAASAASTNSTTEKASSTVVTTTQGPPVKKSLEGQEIAMVELSRRVASMSTQSDA